MASSAFSRTSGRLVARLGPRSSCMSRRHASSNPVTSYTANLSESEIKMASEYCLDLLRKYDSPSYTLQYFIPRGVLSAYLAIRAFNVDVARVADNTSNATVGSMRMQFWRDAINNTFAGRPPKEPVAILLAYALESLASRSEGQANMSKSWFHRVINTRSQYLTNAPYPSLQSLESYAENTYSTLLYLTLSAIPITSMTVDHLASHIGKAAGITAVLRGLPLIAFPPPPRTHNNPTGMLGLQSGAQQGSVTLPLDVMSKAGVKDEEVFRKGADAPGLRDAVFEVATRASDHLITARTMLENLKKGDDVGHDFEHAGEEGHEYGRASGKVDSQMADVGRGFSVLMPAVATQLWLDKLQRVDFDVFHSSLRTTDWRLPFKAYFAFNRRGF